MLLKNYYSCFYRFDYSYPKHTHTHTYTWTSLTAKTQGQDPYTIHASLIQ